MNDSRSWHWVADALGVGWVLVAAVALLTPALVHGLYLGPYDLLSTTGLSAHPGVVAHNPASTDEIDAFIPWLTLAWNQVHHGHLPLWNSYSGLGMPLAFNWQSATFSVPALLAYLFPVHLAYTVAVLATVAIAGTGMYVLGRVLRVGIVACAFAGTVFALSGPISGWLGWPLTSVMSWAGWLFAATILIVRGRHRIRYIAAFAVLFACAVYAGDPEILLLLSLSLLLFVGLLLASRMKLFGGEGPIARPAFELSVAAAIGALLSAPLAFPGLQFLAGASRSTQKVWAGLPLHDLVNVIFQGFNGLPVAGSQFFDRAASSLGYYESVAYVGIIALVLAVTGVALRRRRPEVMAFTVIAVVMAGVACFPALVTWFTVHVPLVGSVRWSRALMPMAFAIAVLAGFGMDAFIRSHTNKKVLYWVGGGFGVSGLLLLALWVVGRGHLDPFDASIRAHSFLWPILETVVGLGVVGALAILRQSDRRPSDGHKPLDLGRWVAVPLLVCETGFLVTAGAPLWSSASSVPSPTPAETALQRAVGSSRVGFGGGACNFGYFSSLGIVPDFNVVYGVHEFAIYDPAVPTAYYNSWRAAGGKGNNIPSLFLYCPAMRTANLARLYGVAFVLESHGSPGPKGAVFDRRVGDENMYLVPGTSTATLSSLTTGPLPGIYAPTTPVRVTWPDPSSLRLVTHSDNAQVLRIRVADIPGWHATIDGRPLPLERFAGIMLQARIPPGQHTVELNYWPTTFTVGLVLALCGGVGLVAALVSDWTRRRRRV